MQFIQRCQYWRTCRWSWAFQHVQNEEDLMLQWINSSNRNYTNHSSLEQRRVPKIKYASIFGWIAPSEIVWWGNLYVKKRAKPDPDLDFLHENLAQKFIQKFFNLHQNSRIPHFGMIYWWYFSFISFFKENLVFFWTDTNPIKDIGAILKIEDSSRSYS